MPIATALSYLGIAKEVTKGTGVAATGFIPVKTITPLDDVMYLPVNVLKGSMAELYGEVQGLKNSTFEIAGPLFPDTFGWPIAGLLGDITTTGASPPYTHAISLLNTGQPTSHSLTDFYGLSGGTPARQYSGMQWHEVEVKFSGDGLLDYTAKGTGWASTTVAKPTASFSTVLPLAAWTGVVTIGGVSVTKLISGTFTFTRKVDKIPVVNNSQNYAQIFLGVVTCKGKATIYADDDAELTRYLTNTQPSFDVNFTSGAGASLVQVLLHFNVAAYTKAQLSRGKEYIAYDIEFEAVANTTDVGASAGYSPTKVTLQNALVSGTYV